MKFRYVAPSYTRPSVRVPAAAQGALTLAGRAGLWLATRAVQALPLKQAGSLAAAALLTGAPAAGRSLLQALPRVPLSWRIGL